MFPPLLKHDAMASMKTKYGMTTFLICPHSWITNDHMYTACNEDHQIRVAESDLTAIPDTWHV